MTHFGSHSIARCLLRGAHATLFFDREAAGAVFREALAALQGRRPVQLGDARDDSVRPATVLAVTRSPQGREVSVRLRLEPSAEHRSAPLPPPAAHREAGLLPA